MGLRKTAKHREIGTGKMGLAEHCVALKSIKVLSDTVGADESTE